MGLLSSLKKNLQASIGLTPAQPKLSFEETVRILTDTSSIDATNPANKPEINKANELREAFLHPKGFTYGSHKKK